MSSINELKHLWETRVSLLEHELKVRYVTTFSENRLRLRYAPCFRNLRWDNTQCVLLSTFSINKKPTNPATIIQIYPDRQDCPVCPSKYSAGALKTLCHQLLPKRVAFRIRDLAFSRSGMSASILRAFSRSGMSASMSLVRFKPISFAIITAAMHQTESTTVCSKCNEHNILMSFGLVWSLYKLRSDWKAPSCILSANARSKSCVQPAQRPRGSPHLLQNRYVKHVEDTQR